MVLYLQYMYKLFFHKRTKLSICNLSRIKLLFEFIHQIRKKIIDFILIKNNLKVLL